MMMLSGYSSETPTSITSQPFSRGELDNRLLTEIASKNRFVVGFPSEKVESKQTWKSDCIRTTSTIAAGRLRYSPSTSSTYTQKSPRVKRKSASNRRMIPVMSKVSLRNTPNSSRFAWSNASSIYVSLPRGYDILAIDRDIVAEFPLFEKRVILAAAGLVDDIDVVSAEEDFGVISGNGGEFVHGIQFELRKLSETPERLLSMNDHELLVETPARKRPDRNPGYFRDRDTPA